MKQWQSEYYLFCGLCGFLLAVAVTTDYHRVVDYLYSDEAVYYMMAQSLAFDRDMEYTQQDLQRVYEDGWSGGPQGVYLTKAANGKIYYGKYLAYSFFLAPFIAAFGVKGFLILNVLLLGGMIWLGWTYLRQFNPSPLALLSALTFFLLSASFIYTFWLTPETFNMFCVTAGLFLWLYRREEFTRAPIYPGVPPGKRPVGARLRIFGRWLWQTPAGRMYLAPIPIAIAAASKITNLLFLAPILADVLLEYKHSPKPADVKQDLYKPHPLPPLRRRGESPLPFRGGVGDGVLRNCVNPVKQPFASRFWPYAAKILLLSVVFGVFVGIFFGLQYKLTGQINQYAGDRKLFIRNFPFNPPLLNDLWPVGIRHSNEDYGKQSFFLTSKTLLYNVYYYVFGRFTGMLPYFGCALLAGYYFFRQAWAHRTSPLRTLATRRRLLLLGVIGATIAGFIIAAPINYHGGSGAFGNRFFLNVYPAFLFLMTTIPRRAERPVPGALCLTWMVGALFLGQALLNPFQTSYYPANPAFNFPYQWLPVELTMINALPTQSNPRLMQTENDPACPYRLYFLNENASELSPREFWVAGGKTVELAVRPFAPRTPGEPPLEATARPAKQQAALVLTITNGPIANQVDVSVAGTTQTIRFENPGQQKRVVFPLKWSLPYFNSFLYPLKIRSHTGYVPKFTPATGSMDPKYLGCRVNIALKPLDIGQGYLEQGRPADALAVLEPERQKQPDNPELRYYLGQAYQQVGDPKANQAARAELEACQALLPKSLPVKTYEAEDASRNTGAAAADPNASGGKSVVFNPATDPVGFMVFGQYADFPAGRYQARYRMAVAKRSAAAAEQGEIALFFDVFTMKYGVLQKDQVVVADGETNPPEAYREYTLNFDLLSPATLEFRVEARGRAQIAVDKIEVYPRLPLDISRALAQAQSKLGAEQDAYQVLRQALAIDPWSVDLQREFLHTLINLKQWDQALQFVQNSPHVARTHTGLATELDPQRWPPASALPATLGQFYQTLAARFAPDIPAAHTFGAELTFSGYGVLADQIRPGGQFTIRYYWQARKPMDQNYAIFVHFAKKGSLFPPEITAKIRPKFGLPVTTLFQQDHQPLDGAYPTSKWLPGELVREQYTVTVPPNIEKGAYEIWLGVWNPFTRTRLESDGQTKVKIGEIQIN